MHFVVGDAALFLQPVKDGGALPAARVDFALHGFRQNARNVFHEAAPGDVGHPLDFHLLQDV